MKAINETMFVVLFYCILFHLAMCITNTTASTTATWPNPEFRGVWVATVGNIDWPSTSQLSPAEQREELIDILDEMARLNLNAIVFQIRIGGVMYPSTFDPWSKYLTGHEGLAPDPFYDPLEFAIGECRKRNLELHAWFNPYIANSGSREGLSKKNMARRFPQYAYVYDRYIWMDPGAKQVQDYIYDVILDVVTRYDVDAIHLDDFFYPYPVGNLSFPDQATYAASGERLTLPDWRRNNVNTLIKRLADGIHDAKPYVKFGISPFGIWKPGHPPSVVGTSAYDVLYTDSRKWLQEGWVDYLSPQLFWAIDSRGQNYTALLDWWLQQNRAARHVYAGLADYRLVTSGWNASEIVAQIEISRDSYNYKGTGNIHFRAGMFMQDVGTISTTLRQGVYAFPALPPADPWLNTTTPSPEAPVIVALTNTTLAWLPDCTGSTRTWALYQLQAETWSLFSVLSSDITTVDHLLPDHIYAIRAVDRLGNLSPPTVVYQITRSIQTSIRSVQHDNSTFDSSRSSLFCMTGAFEQPANISSFGCSKQISDLNYCKWPLSIIVLAMHTALSSSPH